MAAIEANPFHPPSQPGAGTLFTELEPQRVGIVTSNDYDDPAMWSSLHREYHVGAIGTGVAIGDYNGDGWPDLYIVSKVESPRLFRNLGGWRFEDVTEVAGVEDASGCWKQGAAFVDINNDGLLDLFLCRFRAPNLLFVNLGNGAFREEAAERGLAIVDASGMGCFADYDRDGWLDLYLQTNVLDAAQSPDGQRDYLFRNQGDGYFTDVSEAAGILPQPTQGHSATWWDQDGDGWLDLYVANDFAPPDFLYRNNQNGTFTNVIDQTLPHIPYSSMGSDLGDVDNDGRIDLFVADMLGTTHEMTQRGMADSRSKADPTQNEKLDTAIQLLHNALFLNTGTSRSMEAAYLAGVAATDWTWATLFEDLDNDGWLDLFITNGMDREQNNLDLIHRKLSAVSSLDRMRIAKNSPPLNQANLVYANRGELRFEEVGAQWGLDAVGVSFGAAFGDLDRDGDLDLVYTNYQQGPTILRNDSLGRQSIQIALRGRTSNSFGIGARVEATTRTGTQARQLVSARGYLSAGEPTLHFGLGEEDRVTRLRVQWPSGQEQIFEDLPAGHRYTITEPSEEAKPQGGGPASFQPRNWLEEVATELGLDLTQREEELEGTVEQPLLPWRFNRRGPGIAVGDLDGDGVDEIVFGGTTVDGARVFKREGARYRQLAVGAIERPPPVNHGPPLIFDANGDGRNDLLLAAGGAAFLAEEPEYEPQLWFGDGSGGFASAPEGFLPSLPISVGAAVAADFDRDGRLDLFLGGRVAPGYYPETPISALLLQREGRMVELTEAFAPGLSEVGMVTSALASDVDGDGWIDLVVTMEWGSPRFFRNRAGRGLDDVSKEWGFDSAGSGLWTSMAAADFNGDGRLDFAMGNLGLNTLLTATRAEPLRLFASDFARSGQPQLVLAYYAEGALRPVASRTELASRIPEVRKRFPSNNDFAAATLEAILGAQELAQAVAREAGELRSGVLLSQSVGGYSFEALPRLAQLAPVQGLVADDFDGDGRADILLVSNDCSVAPSLGRFDGGLGWLLKGDGAGGFEPVAVSESGWLVPGNPKALAAIDLDGDALPDAVLSRNNQPAMAFRNASPSGQRAVALRLRGRGGNPEAIGARVTAKAGERPLQVAEVRAGGGYASQSSPTLHFHLSEEAAAGASLHVRWPSGAETERPYPATSGYLELRE